jgi:hypothetical protein
MRKKCKHDGESARETFFVERERCGFVSWVVDFECGIDRYWIVWMVFLRVIILMVIWI